MKFNNFQQPRNVGFYIRETANTGDTPMNPIVAMNIISVSLTEGGFVTAKDAAGIDVLSVPLSNILYIHQSTGIDANDS